MFIFVELFRFVGEQIGFEVVVFLAQLVQTLSQVDVLFSVFWFSEFSFRSWISWFQNLLIFPPFLRNSCDEIIRWFWVTIVTVIFTCRYFKLSWNTSALSQWNGRNFSGSSIMAVISYVGDTKFYQLPEGCPILRHNEIHESLWYTSQSVPWP